MKPARWRTALVLGGARSGKSGFAEQLATDWGEPVLYVATATADDDEMADRIARHRARRPPGWRTLEVQRDIATAVRERGDARTIVVEDLTLALSNLMADQHASAAETMSNQDADATETMADYDADAAEARLVRDLSELLRLDANVVLVSNEVGMGLVPPYPLGRAFRDALGRVNQFAAAQASEVYLLVAGLPLRLK